MTDNDIPLLNQTDDNDEGCHAKNRKSLRQTEKPSTTTKTKPEAKLAVPKTRCFIRLYRGVYKLWQLTFALISMNLTWSSAQYGLYDFTLSCFVISATIALLMLLSIVYHSAAYQRKTYSFKATAKYEIVFNTFCFLLYICWLIVYLVGYKQGKAIYDPIQISLHSFALIFFVPVFIFECKYLRKINGYGVTFATTSPEVKNVSMENYIMVTEKNLQREKNQDTYTPKDLQEVILKDPNMINLTDQFLNRAFTKDENIEKAEESSGKKEEQQENFVEGDLADKRNKL